MQAVRLRVVVTALLAVLSIAVTPAAADPAESRRGFPAVVPAGVSAARPNIVLFLTDDQTVEAFQHMAYANGLKDWVRFDNAWINNALCCPSRATILSGRYDTHTSVQTNIQGWRLDDRETIATWLRGRGYRTALIGKYLNGVGDPLRVPPGWDDFQSLLPDDHQYEQYGYSMNVNGRPVEFGFEPADYQVDVLTRKATRFIRRSVAAGKPFLLVFTPTATHGPYVAGPGERGTLASALLPPLPGLNELDVSDKPAYIRRLPFVSGLEMAQRRRNQWEASVSVDHALRAIDDQLRASAVADRTVVILLTDNGFSFGVHRWHYKLCQYRVCSETPLLIRHPQAKPRRVSSYVSNIDIAPTIAEIAGVPASSRLDGRSLVPFLLGRTPASWPTGVLQHWPGGDSTGAAGNPFSIPAFWAVRAEVGGDRYTYVELATGERELYDLAADPHELRNVAGRPGYSTVQGRLADQLRTMKRQALARTEGQSGRTASRLAVDRD